MILSSADFFQNQLFQKVLLRNIIRASKSLDPDQYQHYICSDLGPNCLQKSADKGLSISVIFALDPLNSDPLIEETV